jgi:HK97 family phage prohead protease
MRNKYEPKLERRFIGFEMIARDEAQGSDGEDFIRRFRGTTPTEDRYGDIVVPTGADLKNFHKNPVFLWAHGRGGGQVLPIGRSIKEDVHDKGIDFDIQFDKEDPFALDVMGKYDRGFLRATSIGFMPKDGGTEVRVNEDGDFVGFKFNEWELLELSAVPIPANPDALQLAFDEFLQYVSFAADSEQSPQDVLKDLLHPAQPYKIETVTQSGTTLEVKAVPVAEDTVGDDNHEEPGMDEEAQKFWNALNALGMTEDEVRELVANPPQKVEDVVASMVQEKLRYLAGKLEE